MPLPARLQQRRRQDDRARVQGEPAHRQRDQGAVPDVGVLHQRLLQMPVSVQVRGLKLKCTESDNDGFRLSLSNLALYRHYILTLRPHS